MLNRGAWGGLPPHPPKKSRFNKEKGLKPLIYSPPPPTKPQDFRNSPIVLLTSHSYLFYHTLDMTQLSFMKYDHHAKRHRNRLLRDYTRSHPEHSLTEIGKIFMITRQRVFQILRGK